jgi:ankyrin repeat protein
MKIYEAAETGNLEELQKLIAAGIVNMQDMDGWTALHYAAINGRIECLAELIKAGADINVKNNAGFTPLDKAKYNDNIECIKILEQAQRDLEAKKELEELDKSAQLPEMKQSEFSQSLTKTLEELGTMLLSKNASYGNAALEPLRIFSKADSVEQLKVRIDDKLSRLQRGSEIGEDTVKDLTGYLILYLMARCKNDKSI